MAHLNKNERLIQNAAKKLTPLGAQAFNKMLEFYDAIKILQNEENHDIIICLYCNNHKGKTFANIANALCLSLSKLEDKRKEYQTVFRYFYEIIRAHGASAVAER